MKIEASAPWGIHYPFYILYEYTKTVDLPIEVIPWQKQWMEGPGGSALLKMIFQNFKGLSLY